MLQIVYLQYAHSKAILWMLIDLIAILYGNPVWKQILYGSQKGCILLHK